MTRDEFEDWLEDHRDEALDRIRAEDESLPTWIRLYAKALVAEAEVEPADDDDDEADDLGFDDGD